MNLPKLRRFNCSYNKLTSLPLCILNFKNLQVFTDNNNEIELSLQIAQFIDRIKNKKNKKRRKIKLLAQFDANKVQINYLILN
jgi:Leucine-rich repeat (LRR) protein